MCLRAAAAEEAKSAAAQAAVGLGNGNAGPDGTADCVCGGPVCSLVPTWAKAAEQLNSTATHGNPRMCRSIGGRIITKAALPE